MPGVRLGDLPLAMTRIVHTGKGSESETEKLRERERERERERFSA